MFEWSVWNLVFSETRRVLLFKPKSVLYIYISYFHVKLQLNQYSLEE